MNTTPQLTPYNGEDISWSRQRMVDDSILLESSDSDGGQHDDTTTVHPRNQTQAELNEETKQLQLVSRAKFMKAWSGILKKYEQIDDDKQSDEIDIITGKIYKDNGHLRSLKQNETYKNGVKVEGDIWGDIDEDELQYNSKLARIRRRRNTDRKPMGFLEDNLLLGPSPTKKKKFNQDDLDDISPTKGQIPSSLNHNSSPIKNTTNLNYDRSPIKSTPTKLSFANLSNNQKLNKLNHEDLSILSSSTQISDGDPDSDSSQGYSNTHFNYTSDFDDRTKSILSSGDISTSKAIPSKNFTLYSCYFDCDYCTGNKLLFKDHLLEKHSPELKGLGYPVNVKQELNVDNKSEILNKITSLFPLAYEIPLSTNTSDNERLAGDKCNHEGEMHKQSINSESSSISQSLKEVEVSNGPSIHECPILGCEFLKSGSYSDWRKHMKQNHDVGRYLKEVNRKETNGNAKMLKLDSNKKPDLSKPYQYSSDINEWWDNNSDLEFDTE